MNVYHPIPVIRMTIDGARTDGGSEHYTACTCCIVLTSPIRPGSINSHPYYRNRMIYVHFYVL